MQGGYDSKVGNDGDNRPIPAAEGGDARLKAPVGKPLGDGLVKEEGCGVVGEMHGGGMHGSVAGMQKRGGGGTDGGRGSPEEVREKSGGRVNITAAERTLRWSEAQPASRWHNDRGDMRADSDMATSHSAHSMEVAVGEAKLAPSSSARCALRGSREYKAASASHGASFTSTCQLYSNVFRNPQHTNF